MSCEHWLLVSGASMSRRLSRCLGVLLTLSALLAIVSPVPASAAEGGVEAWQQTIKELPTPSTGCFAANYPVAEWQSTPCNVEPELQYGWTPASRPYAVGAATDYTLVASSPLSSATGTFQNSAGVKEEGIQGGSGPLVANTYSLQLNTNTFTTPLCSTTTNKYGSSGSAPLACKGWEQFIYSSTKNEVFIESWVIYYDGSGNCPGVGWAAVAGGESCTKFSNYSSTLTGGPPTAAELEHVKLTGTSSASADEVKISTTGGHATAVNMPDTPLDLAGEWDRAQWGVYGDCCSTRAEFSGGAKLKVKTELSPDGPAAPTCVVEGHTAETNNLNLQPGPAITYSGPSGPAPTFLAEQTFNAPAEPAQSCGASYNGQLAETKILESGSSNSLCVDPTEPQFASQISGKPNYAGDETSHSGPFPDTGSACAEFFPEEPTRPTPTKAVQTPAYNELIPGVPWVGQENASGFCPPHGIYTCNEQGNDASTSEPRYYIYDEDVTLCENQVASAMLSGRVAADNEVGVFINGTLLATNGNAEGRAGLFGGNENGPLVGFTSRSLKAGVNVLQFVVINENGPTGLEFYSTVTTAESCVEHKEEPKTNAHWLSNGEPIPPGQVEKVKTSGALTFRVNAELSIPCKLKDAETIVNPAGGGNGTDEITTFSLSGCKAKPSPCPRGTKLEVIGGGLPWKTELAAGPPIVDKILGMEIKIQCSGTVLATYKGSLAPTLGASVLEFGGGELQGAGGTLGVSGTDTLTGPKGDEKIGGSEVPEGPAEPHWYSNGKLIPEGQEEPVATSGTVTIGSGEQQTSCKVKDKETIVNPKGGGAGTDELTELVLSGCTSKPTPCPAKTKEEVLALNLPWQTHLIAGPPIRDVIEGVDLQVRCSGKVIETLTGTLEPVVGKSVLEFGTGSGSLTTSTGTTATVGGSDKLTGPKGDEEITAH